MRYREIIAVCSEIHTKHINTLCGQNVELPNVKLAVYIVTTGLYRVTENVSTRGMVPVTGRYSPQHQPLPEVPQIFEYFGTYARTIMSCWRYLL